MPDTVRVVPSKVKFPLSSISPAVPARTTLPAVKSETLAVSATNASIFAVPSTYKSFHSNPLAPKSLAPSVEGTKSLSNLPVAVIVSDVALPKSTSPFAVRVPETVAAPVTFKVLPSNVKLALSSRAPDAPAITTLLSVRSEILAEAAVRSVPSKVKLALSCNSPPDPA